MDYAWALLIAVLSPVISVFVAQANTSKKFEGLIAGLQVEMANLKESVNRHNSAVDSVSSIKIEIENLKRSVDKHNEVVERTYKMEHDVKTAFIRIDELREEDGRINARIDKLEEEVREI